MDKNNQSMSRFNEAQPRRLEYPPNSQKFPPTSTSSIFGSCTFINRVPIPPAFCANFYSPIRTRMTIPCDNPMKHFTKPQPQRRNSSPCSRINELTEFTFHQRLCNFWVHVHLPREFPLPLHSVPNSHNPMRTRMTKSKPQFNEAWLQNQIPIRQPYGHE